MDAANETDNLIMRDVSYQIKQKKRDVHFIVGSKLVGALRQCQKKVVDLFMYDRPIILCRLVVEMLLAYSPA